MDIYTSVPTSDLALRSAVYKAFGGKCFYTGRPVEFEKMQIDHVIPRSLGGEDCIANYVLASPSINRKKSNRANREAVDQVLYLVKTVFAEKVLDYYMSNPKPKKDKDTADYTVLQPVHLGKGYIGRNRRKALDKIAADKDCFWGGNPSIGRWLIDLADQYIAERMDTVKDFFPIVQRVIEDGLASTNEELRVQFEFFASEAGWSDEDIEGALSSPWFPTI